MDPVAYLAEGSARILGLEWVVEDPPEDPDWDELRMEPEERAAYLQEWVLVKGLLWHASNTIVDALFDDVATLHDHDEAWQDTEFIAFLPTRYGHRYDGLFAKMFLVAMVDVTAAAASQWRPLPTVAHELAAHVLLQHVRTVQESFEIELRFDIIGELEEGLFQDRDFEQLYASELDGFEDDPDPQHGAVNLDFASWFVPFKNTEIPAPYATRLPSEVPPPAE